MHDIIVIGAGPAGLTAGIYGVRANKKVLVLEANKVGGKVNQAALIDNYPGISHIKGEDLAQKLFEQAMSLGVKIKIDKAMQIIDKGETKTVVSLDNSYETKSIIIATGNEKYTLNLPNEKELLGKGISYCATCDGNFFKNKDVAIVGGSEEAINDTLYLANICNKVYFIYTNKNLDVSKLNKDNIEIINDKITKINGKSLLESITINNKDIKVSGLFIELSSVPETNYLLDITYKDEEGNIIGDDLHTKKEGIFIAGDIRKKELRQVTTAVADGSIAATLAIRYLNNLKDNNLNIKIYKKNLINETNIIITNNNIEYSSYTKAPGSEEEIREEKEIEDKEIINKFINEIYIPHKNKLIEISKQFQDKKNLTRSKNTATNNLSIKDENLNIEFDCYIQEYNNIPSLFTVEVEKYIKNL